MYEYATWIHNVMTLVRGEEWLTLGLGARAWSAGPEPKLIWSDCWFNFAPMAGRKTWNIVKRYRGLNCRDFCCLRSNHSARFIFCRFIWCKFRNRCCVRFWFSSTKSYRNFIITVYKKLDYWQLSSSSLNGKLNGTARFFFTISSATSLWPFILSSVLFNF